MYWNLWRNYVQKRKNVSRETFIIFINPLKLKKMGTLLINGKEYTLRTEKTTIATIKKMVGSVANVRKIAKKDLQIVLPDGRKVTYRELDLFKDTVKEINFGTYAGADVDDNCANDVKKLYWLTNRAYETPVNFGQLGSRDQSVFAEISENTQKRLVLAKTLYDGTEVDENFIKLIGE